MAESKKKGHSKDQHYAGYKNGGMWLKNKIRSLKRHLRAFPNDALATEALAKLQKGGVNYHRKRPAKRVWRRSRALMALSHTVRTLGYKGDMVLHLPWNLGHPDRLSILPDNRG